MLYLCLFDKLGRKYFFIKIINMKTKSLSLKTKFQKLQLRKKSISKFWGGQPDEMKTSVGGPTCPISTYASCLIPKA